ncbi:TPA: hypothetical protein ACIVP6_003575, partial [Salmonella enterica subsp. enterica serovar Wangata]
LTYVRLVNSPFRYQRRYIGKRLTTPCDFPALSQALLNAHTGISLVAICLKPCFAYRCVQQEEKR